jgi:hypothetical protein
MGGFRNHFFAIVVLLSGVSVAHGQMVPLAGSPVPRSGNQVVPVPPALQTTDQIIESVEKTARGIFDRLPQGQVPTVSLPGQPMTFDEFEPKVDNPKQYTQQQLNYFRSYWLRAYDCYLILFQWLNSCLSEAEMRDRENSVFPRAETGYLRKQWQWVCSEAFIVTYKNRCVSIPYNLGQSSQQPLR